MKDSMSKSAGKTSCDATGKPAPGKTAAASTVSTTDFSFDTKSLHLDDFPKSRTERTPLSLSENATKTPSVTEMKIPLVTKPPAKRVVC